MIQSMWTLFCFSFVTSAVSENAAIRAETLIKTTRSIAVAGDNAARREAITTRIKALGLTAKLVPFSREDYQGKKVEGVNILVELPSAATRSLILGGHYDRVSVGAGAVDNAAACAVLLELLQILKEKPPANWKTTVAFWDQEEVGLIGSGAHVEANKDALPDLYLNFDVFAYGDSLWVMSPDEGGRAAKAVRQAAAKAKFPITMGASYPPSDHLVFIKAKVETLSFSLAGADEIAEVLEVLKQGKITGAPPKVLKIIHTANDTIDQVDAAAMAKALPVVVQAIRLIDLTE